MWSASARSTSKLVDRRRSSATCFGPASVPETETSSPPASVPRTVTTLRWSGRLRAGGQPDLDAALLGEQRGVDVGDRLVDDVLEHALERGQFQHLHVVLGDLAAHLDVEADRDLAGQRGEDAAELLGERQTRAHVLGDDAALHVDRVRHQLAGEREAHRAGDRDAGLLLRLVGGGAQVRGGDDLVELEQRGVGARLLGVDVEAGAGDPALLERAWPAPPRRRCRRGRR